MLARPNAWRSVAGAVAAATVSASAGIRRRTRPRIALRPRQPTQRPMDLAPAVACCPIDYVGERRHVVIQINIHGRSRRDRAV